MESRFDLRIIRSPYVVAALACSTIAVTGFARSYFLKSLFGSPPLPVLLHVHGVIMSLWCVLFFVQVYLVATDRIHVHRRLGILGAVLAFSVVTMGTYTTVEATAASSALCVPLSPALSSIVSEPS